MPAAARSMLLSVAVTLVATALAWSAESPRAASPYLQHGPDGRGTAPSWQGRPISPSPQPPGHLPDQTRPLSPTATTAGADSVRQAAGATTPPQRPMAPSRFRPRNSPSASPSQSVQGDAPNRPAATQRSRPRDSVPGRPSPTRSRDQRSSTRPDPIRAGETTGLARAAGGENAAKTARTTAPVPLPSESLRLTPPGSGTRSDGNKSGVRSTGPSVVTTVSSLALVLSLLLVCMWVMRRTSRSAAMTRLPEDVVEVLGRANLVGRQQLYLVRLGNKLLLLSVTAAAVETLAEITDAVEIDRIVGRCRQSQPGSVAASFRQVLTQLSHATGPDRVEKRAVSQGLVRTPTQGLAQP